MCALWIGDRPLSCPGVDNAAYKPTSFVHGIQWLDFLDAVITHVSLMRHWTLNYSLTDFFLTVLELFEGKQPVLRSHPLGTRLHEMQSYRFSYSLKLVGAASVSEDLVLIHSGLSSSILVTGEYE